MPDDEEMNFEPPSDAAAAASVDPSALSYASLEYDGIAAELERLALVEQELQARWEAEVALYEENMTVKVNGRQQSIPRRNLLNLQGNVQDPDLFPYHDCCYKLIDTYDCLYSTQAEHPIPRNAVYAFHDDAAERTRALPPDFHTMPCAADSIFSVLWGLALQPESNEANDFSLKVLHQFVLGEIYLFLQNQATLQLSVLQAQRARLTAPGETPVIWEALQEFSRGRLRPDGNYVRVWHDMTPITRTSVLLRIVQHALSDLQRDHKLALHATMLLVWHHDLDDVQVLRQLLLIWMRGYVVCENETCTWRIGDDVDHHCEDVARIRCYLGLSIGCGITFMTREHAHVLAAFCLYAYQREFRHLVGDLANLRSGTTNVQEQFKMELKRSVLDVEHVRGRENIVPDWLIIALFGAVSRFVRTERHRMFSAAQSPGEYSMPLLQSSLESSLCGLACMAHVAASTSVMLPECERFTTLASHLAHDIVYALNKHVPDRDGPYSIYLGRRGELEAQSFGRVLRFHDAICNAKDRVRVPIQSVSQKDPAIDTLLHSISAAQFGRPPDDLRDALRALYGVNGVKLHISGIGYGDALLWCRYEITPQDSLLGLYYLNVAVPDAQDSDEEGETDNENPAASWVAGPMGDFMPEWQMWQYHQSSLIALNVAWYSPWSPAKHATYQAAFRAAALAWASVGVRFQVPAGIRDKVVEYLPRDWWLDERAECNNANCVQHTMGMLQLAKLTGNQFSSQRLR